MQGVQAESFFYSGSEENSLLNLPLELHIHIFSFLSPGELTKNVCLVNKAWKILGKDDYLWKRFYRLSYPEIESSLPWKDKMEQMERIYPEAEKFMGILNGMQLEQTTKNELCKISIGQMEIEGIRTSKEAAFTVSNIYIKKNKMDIYVGTPSYKKCLPVRFELIRAQKRIISGSNILRRKTKFRYILRLRKPEDQNKYIFPVLTHYPKMKKLFVNNFLQMPSEKLNQAIEKIDKIEKWLTHTFQMTIKTLYKHYMEELSASQFLCPLNLILDEGGYILEKADNLDKYWDGIWGIIRINSISYDQTSIYTVDVIQSYNTSGELDQIVIAAMDKAVYALNKKKGIRIKAKHF